MDLKPGTPSKPSKSTPSSSAPAPTAASKTPRRAKVVDGYHVATTVRAMVVPGSQAVKHQAESEGLDRIFKTAGFEWREPGCSMCLGMNPDILSQASGVHRQAPQTSKAARAEEAAPPPQPAMAAAAAITATSPTSAPGSSIKRLLAPSF